MADEFCFSLLHSTTLQILQAAGFDAGHSKATHALTNVFAQYLELLSTTTSVYSHLSGRTTGNIYDCMDALNELAIDLPTFKTWLEDEAKSLSPCWTEQSDPSRILKAIVNDGLNRQEDVIVYKYNERDMINSAYSEEEEEHNLSAEKISENKENNLPDYVPPYFPPFPVIISPEDDNEEQAVIEAATAKTELPTVALDALPLPNIVKKKTRPIDNPFTYLKPFDESMLATVDADQPDALPLSMKILADQKASPSPLTENNENEKNPLKRRRSTAFSQLMSEIEYHEEPNKRKLAEGISLFNEATREGAAPGNTMFSHESGLLNKLMTDFAPPIAVPKLLTPNLLMDIVVPPGSVAPISTLRLNMTSASISRKPSLGSITIEESPASTPAPIPATTTDTNLLSTTTEKATTTIKISPISLSALSLPVEERKSSKEKPTKEKKEKPIKEKKEKPVKEKKEKASKPKKKLTISLPKPKFNLLLSTSANNSTITHDTTEELTTVEEPLSFTAPPESSTSSSAATPVIRFTIKPPTEQKQQQEPESTPPQSPKNGITSDVINCICDNPTVDYGNFMVACDTCGVWFHGLCVGIAESDQTDEWHCSRCTK